VTQRRVELYGDYACPFSYLAEQVAQALRSEGVPVAHRAFELRPAGTPPMEWPAGVEQVAAEWRVALRRPVHGVRTGKAHEAAKQAAAKGAHAAMHEALFRAHFVDGRDIGRIDVLAVIAGEVGLDASEMRVVLDVDRWADEVAADRSLATALGIDATPALVVTGDAGSRVLLGLEAPAALIERVRAAMEETRT
jgi:predicted DsbA family dithiol-disulfide isomerase